MEIRALEKWRIERLQKVVKIASAMLCMDEGQLKTLIESIDDYRGQLQVSWKHPMTDHQCRCFAVAWEMCGESRTNVENRVFW